MQLLRKLFAYPEVWVLTFIALLTRLWYLGRPSDIVFDEVYFRQFAADYLSGHYFFDIHPPLVKLLFAGVGTLFGLSPHDVAEGAAGVEVLRILPAIAGAILVPLMYVVLRQFGLSRRIATLGALFVLCDNALLVESRFVLMDSLLLLFGIAAISCFLQFRKSSGRRRVVWLVGMSLCIGMLVGTKWTGLAIAGLLAVVWLYEYGMQKSHKNWRQFVSECAVVVAIVSGVYIGCFAIHFSLLPFSGDGDVFMSER
ncbi:phospholipid carrier-dependent glycosyltransferase, partial [Candidatus Saccharibacteria bacterium]|nr:phospholipid carrier-dependent glycosyltransferase [Candidatus Saccharibacteria bacterium]